MDEPAELLGPFTEAVAATLREMAGVEAVVRGVSRAADGDIPAGVTAAIRLNADVPGWLALSLPAGTAAVLAGRVFAEAGLKPDAGMVADCVAELVNVVAGQAKTLTFGTPGHFTLTTPEVLGPGAVAPPGRWVVNFGSDAGAFALHVCPPRAAGTGGGLPPVHQAGE